MLTHEHDTVSEDTVNFCRSSERIIERSLSNGNLLRCLVIRVESVHTLVIEHENL